MFREYENQKVLFTTLILDGVRSGKKNITSYLKMATVQNNTRPSIENMHFQIVLSDVDQSSSKSLVMFSTENKNTLVYK